MSEDPLEPGMGRTVWQPTQLHRYERRVIEVARFVHQQLWRTPAGLTEWRDVPTVDEEGKPI